MTEDRLAILDVIARYAHAYDGLDADEFSRLFVEDGVFEVFVPGQTSPAGTLFDELAPDAAVTRTVLLVTHQHAGEPAPRSTLSGTYHDRWRKTEAGWRLARRTARVDQDADLAAR